MRAFVRVDIEVISDANSFADILHIFCPKCDGATPKVFPGSVVCMDEVISETLGGVLKIAPGVIEYGYFRLKSPATIHRVIQKVETVDHSFVSELAVLGEKLQNPLERIKYLKEMNDREKKRQKEEKIRRVLESWSEPVGDGRLQWEKPKRKSGTVTIMIGNKKLTEVELE
jgi:hypothetical protein